MSQQKAQLVSPIDTFTPPGINVTGAGIVTSTSFVGSGGTVTGIVSGTNLNVGVITATSYSGDGSGLVGVGASAFVGVVTAAQSGTTTIDLSLGNAIYFTQDTDTTVAFANTSTTQKLKFIRVKDDTTDARTITWPSSIIWNGGTAPTLIDSSDANDVQIFNLTTIDQGVTWYGYEAMKNDPAESDGSVIGTLWSWGTGTFGMTANNDQIPRSSPTQVPGTQWKNIRVNHLMGYATKSDDTLWAWGYNYGNLGQGDVILRSSPVQIPGTWSKITTDSSRGFGIKFDGTLWVIGGKNQHGCFGLNDNADRSSPTQIPGTEWSFVSGGGSSVFATKTNGTLWSWGYNRDGTLFHNDTVARSSPTQVPGTQWGESMHNFSMGARVLKTDGTLWVGGYNYYGSLGMNNRTEYSSPAQVSGTQWSKLGEGEANVTFATKTDGTLWVWGNGNYGDLGQNDKIKRSSPVQIPGTQWKEITHKLATKTDGTLWGWGANGGGRLAQNDNVQYSSPVQIPGTQWSGKINAYGQSFAIKAI